MEVLKESAVFFSILEKDLQLIIPCHLKNILNIRGFNNAFVLKTLKDADISKMEDYARQKLLEIIRSNLSETERIEDICTHFFGKYSNEPNEFKFSSDEKELILRLAEYTKYIADSKVFSSGLAHFTSDEYNETPNRYFSVTIIKEPAKERSHTHFVLNRLKAMADQNVSREKPGYRYDDDVKQLGSYIRMVAGPHAYETLQKNLELALPSISSLNRYIKQYDGHLIEGELRSMELLKFLELRNLPLVVSLSEDATSIEGRPQYDSRTNQIMGLVLPINISNGMPIPKSYPARSVDEMASYFLNQRPTARLVNVIMAQPLANVSPFCLLLFTSDAKYTAEHVMKRWKYVTAELLKLKIHVLSFASDSYPTYNSAMRKLTALGSASNIFGDARWFSMGLNQSPPFYVQDPTHIGTKLRNIFLKTGQNPKKLPFGSNFFIQLDHLKFLLDNVAKDHHQLTLTTIDPNDRQNFDSVLRITSRDVINLLGIHVANSEATVAFLDILRRIIDSYMDPKLLPLERIEKIWYSVFVIRMWRQFITSNKKFKLKENFLTLNSYTCIEINAHSLTLIMLCLERHKSSHLFKPSLLDSQPCEGFFRQIRSFTSTYSMIVNCTVKEMVGRINKIQLQNDIAFLSPFKFPRVKFANENKDHQNISLHVLPNVQDIEMVIKRSKEAAVEFAVRIGLIKDEDIQNGQCFICQVPLLKMKVGCQSVRTVEDPSKKLLFRNILKLKNFSEKFGNEEVPENSPYVEIKCFAPKRYIVKKTSLCWLLRTDCAKLSSDRRIRVKQPMTLAIQNPRKFTKRSKASKLKRTLKVKKNL